MDFEKANVLVYRIRYNNHNHVVLIVVVHIKESIQYLHLVDTIDMGSAEAAYSLNKRVMKVADKISLQKYQSRPKPSFLLSIAFVTGSPECPKDKGLPLQLGALRMDCTLSFIVLRTKDAKGQRIPR